MWDSQINAAANRILVLDRSKKAFKQSDVPSALEHKVEMDIFIKSKRLHDERMDEGSPSKLRVADLSLGEEKVPSRSRMQW